MTYKNNTYRNITITSILSIILISSGMSMAYAANFPGSNTFGGNTVASGPNSAAFGVGSTASGSDAIAFGNSNTVSGDESAGFGVGTTTTARHSATFGHYTTAQSSDSLVLGQCNEISGDTYNWVLTDPLFVIGNGAFFPDNCITKNNAVTVLKNGNVGIGVSNPQQLLVVKGIINSTSGGFVFPDGTTQTTANIDNSITNEIETWSTLSGIPAGFSDNIDDNTQLTETQVDNFVTNNGYSTGSHTLDTNLDKAGIEAYGFVTGSHTVDTNTQLDQAGIEGFGFRTADDTMGVIFAEHGGNVGIDTTNPNSKLEVANGYFELDTSSGIPPASDCDSMDEIGRMKMDSANNNLYVCSNNGWQTK